MTEPTDNNIVTALTQVLLARKGADPRQSYVASLYQAGTNKILEKVGEEATEVIIAGKDLAAAEPRARQGCKTELTKEVADLWFHCMVLLCHLGLTPADVLDLLAQRFGVGGHEEKAARAATKTEPGADTDG